MPNKLKKKNKQLSKKICRDKARNFVVTNPDYVATKLEDKLFRDKAKDKPKTNFVATKFFCCNKVLDKLCCDKVLICRDIVLGIQNADVVTQKC